MFGVVVKGGERAPKLLSLSSQKSAAISSYMSNGLNSLKGGYIGDCIGNYYRGY